MSSITDLTPTKPRQWSYKRHSIRAMGRTIMGYKVTTSKGNHILFSDEEEAKFVCGVSQLIELAEGIMNINPAFRSMPVGSPNSHAREQQDLAIEYEDRLKRLILDLRKLSNLKG
jgi:hypothetical protein